MTNFDKWKAELNEYSFANMMLEIYCGICPARDNCERGLIGDACRKQALAWAKEEIYPDGPYCTGCNHVVYKNGNRLVR